MHESGNADEIKTGDNQVVCEKPDADEDGPNGTPGDNVEAVKGKTSSSVPAHDPTKVQEDKDKKTSANAAYEPIWKDSKWLTALAGLVTALITIPSAVSDYLSKMQDIQLEEVKKQTALINNSKLNQDREFAVVKTTLAEQGEERIFILRYLAATLDDEDAKKWAKDEVKRIDDLIAKEKEISKLKNQLAIAQGDYEEEQQERQQQQLNELESEATLLRKSAGIVPSFLSNVLHSEMRLEIVFGEKVNTTVEIVVEGERSGKSFICNTDSKKLCILDDSFLGLPRSIEISTDPENVKSVDFTYNGHEVKIDPNTCSGYSAERFDGTIGSIIRCRL